MAFVPEDGTGLPAANAYASYADWLAHWADRGPAPAGVQADIEKALVRGADYLGLKYEWIGYRKTTTQSLDWPRLEAYEEHTGDGCWVAIEGVPAEVKRANIELAQRALAGELTPDPVVDDSGQTVTKSRDKLGPIETEREFTGASGKAFVKSFPAVDKLLRKLVWSSAGKVYRA